MNCVEQLPQCAPLQVLGRQRRTTNRCLLRAVVAEDGFCFDSFGPGGGGGDGWVGMGGWVIVAWKHVPTFVVVGKHSKLNAASQCC